MSGLFLPLAPAQTLPLFNTGEGKGDTLQFDLECSLAMVDAREKRGSGLFIVPPPAPEPTQLSGTPASGIPEVLSPSSVNTFAHDCQVKWYYRRVLQMPETRGAALGLGTAVDEALGTNFRQKIETKQDLPTDGVIDLFRDSWSKQLDTIVLDKGDDMEDLKNAGETMTRVYMDKAAPRIQPAAVQKEVQGEIGGVPVKGYIDLVDVHGHVIDIKTSKKKPSGMMASHLIQIATYAILDPTASGFARLDTLTKTKTVALHQDTVHIGEPEKRYAARLYSIARDAMRSGLYMPNRQSNLCSRKYCSYWAICEQEHGGRVKGGGE